MNKDTITTFERHEMLFDAIHEAAEDAILCGCVPAMGVMQIEEATRRLRELARDRAAMPSRDHELLDDQDLEAWEKQVSVQAAVLAAMLCNDPPGGEVMDDQDDEMDRPLPRDPDLLRERLLDVVIETAEADIDEGRMPIAVTHETRVQFARLRHELFGEPIGPVPFDAEEERRAQEINAAAEKRTRQAQLAAILSRGIGEA